MCIKYVYIYIYIWVWQNMANISQQSPGTIFQAELIRHADGIAKKLVPIVVVGRVRLGEATMARIVFSGWLFQSDSPSVNHLYHLCICIYIYISFTFIYNQVRCFYFSDHPSSPFSCPFFARSRRTLAVSLVKEARMVRQPSSQPDLVCIRFSTALAMIIIT